MKASAAQAYAQEWRKEPAVESARLGGNERKVRGYGWLRGAVGMVWVGGNSLPQSSPAGMRAGHTQLHLTGDK